jgi:hypothetical protein
LPTSSARRQNENNYCLIHVDLAANRLPNGINWWPRAPIIRGTLMIATDQQPSATHVPSEVADEVDEARLAEVMRVVPLGAGVLAGAAVALLVIGYLAIYLLVFLARGVVG